MSLRAEGTIALTRCMGARAGWTANLTLWKRARAQWFLQSTIAHSQCIIAPQQCYRTLHHSTHARDQSEKSPIPGENARFQCAVAQNQLTSTLRRMRVRAARIGMRMSCSQMRISRRTPPEEGTSPPEDGTTPPEVGSIVRIDGSSGRIGRSRVRIFRGRKQRGFFALCSSGCESLPIVSDVAVCVCACCLTSCTANENSTTEAQRHRGAG